MFAVFKVVIIGVYGLPLIKIPELSGRPCLKTTNFSRCVKGKASTLSIEVFLEHKGGHDDPLRTRRQGGGQLSTVICQPLHQVPLFTVLAKQVFIGFAVVDKFFAAAIPGELSFKAVRD